MTESSQSKVDKVVKQTGLEPGGTPRWPSVEELASAQDMIESDSIRWLAYCKDLAKRRLPQSCYDAVPETIWRFKLGGSKVVIMRTPQVEQQGSIVIPGTSQRPNEIGWIISVGPHIHDTTEPNIQGREYTYRGFGDFSPLLAVGDLVLFNRHAGQALVSSLIDEGAIHRSKAQQFLLISIADIFGPLVQVGRGDWSPVQEDVFVPTNNEKRIITQ